MAGGGNGTLTGEFAVPLASWTCPGRPLERTYKGHLMQTDAGTHRAADSRFVCKSVAQLTRGLFAGPRALFVPWLLTDGPMLSTL